MLGKYRRQEENSDVEFGLFLLSNLTQILDAVFHANQKKNNVCSKMMNMCCLYIIHLIVSLEI